MREVESQPLRRDERARLPRVRPDDATQRRVQKVRRRVIAPDVPAAVGVHLRQHVVVDGDAPLDDAAAMQDEPALGALRVLDAEATVGPSNLARVADLAALLGVERRLEEDDLRLVARLDAIDRCPAGDDASDARLLAKACRSR